MTRNPELAVPMTLPEIREDLEQIRERWRSGTAGERKRDLLYLDDLLGELDDLPADSFELTEAVDQLRGRVEILMDQIEISLGIETR
jgi:hypothetical protein